MGRLKATLLALVLAVLAATLLSACGEDKAALLPGETARDINANLTLVEDLVAEGDCEGASNAAAAVGQQVEELGGVDKKLKEALAEGAARLKEVVVECSEASEEETTATTEPEGEELGEEEREKQDKAAEKEAEKEQKQKEKEEKKEVPSIESPGPEKEEESAAPPTEPEDGGTPSGGVSPSTPAGGE